MLYLDDYIELIEGLPNEMRDRCTRMRELDLEVQNEMDRLGIAEREFFHKCLYKSFTERDELAEFDRIKKRYLKVVGLDDDKIKLASQMEDAIERHIQKLDQELHKFKMELEADSCGLTAMLEKKSIQLDQPIVGRTLEKRKRQRDHMNGARHEHAPLKAMRTNQSDSTTLAAMADAKNDTAYDLLNGYDSRSHSPASRFGDDAASTGGGVRAPSLSRVNSDAGDLLGQGTLGLRRSNTRIDYDRLSRGTLNTSRHAAAPAGTGGAEDQMMPSSSGSKKDKKRTATQLPSAGIEQGLDQEWTPGAEASDEDEEAELDEQRYCYCNRVSFGNMIACDNEDCPYEWFHNSCVNLTSTPKGKWYCPDCTNSMKRRKGTVPPNK